MHELNSTLNQPQAEPSTAQASLQCIAAQVGVSMTTVSRVLSGQARRYRISRKTESAICALARELNFVPNQLARGLRLKKTLTIGLIIPDISNPFFAAIARQVAQGSRVLGYSVILCDSQEDARLELQAINLLRGRSVEGMILCPVGQTCAHLEEFERGGLPLVLVDRYFPDRPLPFVSSDNLAGAREATGHLLEHGHRSIACLQGLRGSASNDLRLQGYKEALASHGLTPDEALIVGDDFSEQSGYISTRLLLRSRKDVTAILSFSNLNALGALRALAEEKRLIPEDISIVSFDDQPYAAYLATPLTTVTQPVAEMGEVAVKLLFDQIRTPQQEFKGGMLLPTRLIVRKSVRSLSSMSTIN